MAEILSFLHPSLKGQGLQGKPGSRAPWGREEWDRSSSCLQEVVLREEDRVRKAMHE